ncbi:MAG: sulfite exporter TauE/SafE family protein, partial [Rhodospirillales bacterium]|nr:sulfite exporter TauE/SafE family protein [Rhodospirillales bacterium]
MLLAWCSPNGPALAWGLLLAGLAGSVLHCGPMCGPFVLGQVSDRLAHVPAVLMCERSRIQAALLLPYHVGRLLSYAVLGAVAAQFGGLARLGFVPSALLLLGGLL